MTPTATIALATETKTYPRPAAMQSLFFGQTPDSPLFFWIKPDVIAGATGARVNGNLVPASHAAGPIAGQPWQAFLVCIPDLFLSG